ncbi:hypothetical protein KFK09_019426 [Dendrobium nobile]|uniref:SAP domain-containing protein n=1 Tax=Dendrobium nobile TaxID=94219 RepID=A0A8T3AR31_DENNO|nr:hypothetical protein KFK09_019426 [Dendrobium nobile]
MWKAKQAILNSYSDNVVEDDEDEEESGSYLGQTDEDDNESEEEEEELESLEEDYEDEESDSDQEGDVESDGCSDEDEDEDEYYESISDDESNEDDGDKVCDWKEGKPTDKDHRDKVVNLLRQRSKKLHVLKLEECKAYLRKHDLMISGTKETCIRRIIEHWRLGDVVMFKQRVYDKFSKVSRNGKVIGKRTIAGRVVKESYGSAKQQHTFTRWANEADRSKVLEEKHRRGATARHVRASNKARVSAGSKRKRSLTDSKQHQIKRQKKPSEASTSGRNQPNSYNNAKAHTKYSSNNKIRANSSSPKHSKKLKTKTSSYTNTREVDQYTQKPSSPNIFDNSHPDLHQRNKFAVPQVSRERFIMQPYSAYASQFDHRGHLSHHYSTSISPYDSRSSGHFFAPDFYDQRYAVSQFQRSNRPWPM